MILKLSKNICLIFYCILIFFFFCKYQKLRIIKTIQLQEKNVHDYMLKKCSQLYVKCSRLYEKNDSFKAS